MLTKGVFTSIGDAAHSGELLPITHTHPHTLARTQTPTHTLTRTNTYKHCRQGSTKLKAIDVTTGQSLIVSL